MRIETRRAALRAAGKVALVSSAIACGATTNVDGPVAESNGVTTTPDDPRAPFEENEPTAVAPDSGRESSARDAKAAADSSATGCESGEQSFECCQTRLHADHPDAAGLDAVDASASTRACCEVLAAHYDTLVADGGSEGWDWENDQEVKSMCCSAIHFQGQTCTPWGPPMPPAMRLAKERLVA